MTLDSNSLQSSSSKKVVIRKRRKWSALLGDGGEKEYFVDNLSMLLASGMDILNALGSIREGVRTSLMKDIIDGLREDISDGSPLWKALKRTNLLSEHILALFRIGEESGKLSENLKVINNQQQKERVFRSKIHSAMMYPVLVLSLTLVVGIGIAWFILPRLSSVFSQLNMELPIITRWLINFGDFLGEYGIIVIPLFIAFLLLLFYIIFSYPKTKFIGQWLLFHFPVVKNVILQIEVSRFGYILGNLLDAGIPIVEALHSLTQATTFRMYQNLYKHLEFNIEQGNSFHKSFNTYPHISNLIPATVQQMLESGEQSGNLTNMLTKVGVTFEEKTETSTKNLSVMLEPILLIIVWGGVVMVALAVILPIYSLIGGLNTTGDMNTSTPPSSSSVESTRTLLPQVRVTDQVPTLNVRTEPYGELVAKVLAGEEFEYKSIDQNWYEIVLKDGTTGWVSGNYVTVLDDLVTPTHSAASPNILEIRDTELGYLNVRQSPRGQFMTRVTPGEKYQYTEESEGWYKIILNAGSAGWVSGDYVTLFSNE